ncbi:MAG: metallophosphoesterase [Sphingobacteriales bacterium]|nr:metallophosphoesterase [Sphingobacteriales bacterium]
MKLQTFLQSVFRKLVLWASAKFDSKPDKERVFNALSKLLDHILNEPGKKGFVISHAEKKRIIIFSDQHKGRRNGADDFVNAERNYLESLNFYYKNHFYYINLGDGEELWENTLSQIKRYNIKVFSAEKKFHYRNSFAKIFGNHDLYWANDPLAGIELKKIYGKKTQVYEGILINIPLEEKGLQIFCTHGHQGDKRSDGNMLTKFFISRIWAPLQAYLKINTNEPSNNNIKKTEHNQIMYEWAAEQTQTLLITGHTHQPVFESLTRLERLHRTKQIAIKENDTDTIHKINLEIENSSDKFDSIRGDYTHIRPSYFNTGCCCFSDGDITGIEIDNGFIRLIKWGQVEGVSQRIVLEEKALKELI